MERLRSLKDKVILVTGAAGFIGSHLTRRLIGEGAEVHVLISRNSNQFRIQDITKDLKIWYGDVRDYPSVSFCIKNSKPQIIFHLAAFRNVKRDPELIDTVINVNIKGTLNLLQRVLEEKVDLECFVNTGASEEYGDGETPFSEDQREMPVSPYSASKVAVTHFCQMLCKTMGLPIVTVRPFLTYGPFQDTDMFIPSLIHHCLQKKDFAMTEGDQTREFNYVDDVVEAFLLAAVSREALGEVINIGNGIEYRIRDVAEKIVLMMGSPIKLLIGALPKRPGENRHFFCINEKARRLLGWVPRISLDEGLERTIKWYKNLDRQMAEFLESPV
ncbi:MAG: SDR family NAD(P)-dependent oxidoreductase [Nitrospirota bacterium]